MCYHISKPSVRALKNNFKDGFHIVTDDSERCSGYDHPDLPATLAFGAEELTALEWGLIPAWARDLAHARQLQNGGLNARDDMMFDRPMFRDSATHRRCLIWLDGFYEWQHAGKKKVPYHIHMPGGALMAVGGLWSEWRDPLRGVLFRTCAIVTTAANELMSEIHNTKRRMPFIVGENVRQIWLEPTRARADIAAICRPFADGILQADPVIAEPEKKEPGQLDLF